MRRKNIRISSIILSVTLMLPVASFTAFAESKTYTKNDPNSTQGQHFTADDPRGIGTFTDKEIKDGLEKSNLACEVIAIRNKSLSNPKSITSKDVAKVQTYINNYSPSSTITDYIPDSINAISTTVTPMAIGDGQKKIYSFPGIVQKADNFCAPASMQAILGYKGISVTQDTLAGLCGIKAGGSGTVLGKVAPALNHYNKANGGSTLSFNYATLLPSSVPAANWNVKMTDSAIATLVGNYGVVYDVHMVKGSPNYLSGYSTMVSSNIYHYVAGEGFDATNSSSRQCYYYDSNNLKTNLGSRHMNVPFATMGVLTNDMGLVY